ncbi:MAG TPA: ATP-binding cassette domain-containing protein, partial [Solirubrobacterales bacterium]|nr:ATP-binding cassette domain-containing protein [Solirubrobacterales bacterium]
MSVYDNMAFGLMLRKFPKEEIKRRVMNAAKILDIGVLLDRKPKALSGGQRQRVAMGRAIVRNPKVFLFDEPLSNLDAKLRVQMRTEISRIQQRMNTTTIYVTHDQTEAMTLGDRVAVMRAGVLQQVGTPAELYDTPKNLFVAGFIGSPAMNFMPGELSGGRLKLPIGEVDAGDLAGDRKDGPVVAGLRPENFEDVAVIGDLKEERGVTFEAEIDLVESLGSDLFAYFHIDSEGVQSDQLADLVEESLEETGAGETSEGREQVVARLDPTSKVKRRESAELWADTSKLHLFDPESGESLRT